MSTYDLEKYKKGFTANDSVNSAAQKKTAAESKVANYGDFNYSKQNEYDKALGDYLGRDKFSYDVNKDALYSSLKKQYENSGKMAMEDTMGKANAMNGGYGTSYGVTAGQQVYNDYMKEAAAMMPEYYQMALDRYIAEGDELLNRYNLLGSDRANEQAEWDAGYNRALAERDYAAGDYADQYNRAYGEWADKRDYDYQLARDAETDKQWQQSFDYQKERDGIDDAWKQKQLDWEKEAAGYEARIAELEAGGDEDFERFTYSGLDEETGKNVFYRDGKKYLYDIGVNPYTGTRNPDAKNGTFGNGYQPDNIGTYDTVKNGKKETVVNKLKKTKITDVINGVTQNIWTDEKEGRLWIWDGTQNRYLEYDDSEA